MLPYFPFAWQLQVTLPYTWECRLTKSSLSAANSLTLCIQLTMEKTCSNWPPYLALRRLPKAKLNLSGVEQGQRKEVSLHVNCADKNQWPKQQFSFSAACAFHRRRCRSSNLLPFSRLLATFSPVNQGRNSEFTDSPRNQTSGRTVRGNACGDGVVRWSQWRTHATEGRQVRLSSSGFFWPQGPPHWIFFERPEMPKPKGVEKTGEQRMAARAVNSVPG